MAIGWRRRIVAWLIPLFVLAGAARAEGPLRFRVTLDESVAKEPVTGRLYVFLSQRGQGAPMKGPDWFNPEPFFGLDVEAMRPGESRFVDDAADGFPEKLSKLPAGSWRAQAVLDRGFYHQHHARAPGNFYSQTVTVELDPAHAQGVPLTLTRVVPRRPFAETKWVKEVAVASRLLSEFHGREVIDRCAVVLPRSYYDEPRRRYPAMYVIPGFGGDHRQALRYAEGAPAPGPEEVELIRVYLNGQCKWGHHVYADSATNGPRGRALVEELIPHVDATFRTIAEPTARFVHGHSSGGWSSLWLQVTYPDTFGGVWSLSPDPVDFRDYQQVNLYASLPLSLYVDEAGNRRPIARRNGRPVLWYDSFGKMDDTLGRGGQLRSFEAVFSPLDEGGLPQKLWDRQTGRIDPQVAAAWRKHDINAVLEDNWETLGPKLRGKLHIVTGELDTFYLEGAVELLGQTLRRLGSDAVVEVLPGESHSSLLTPERFARIRREMSALYRRSHGE